MLGPTVFGRIPNFTANIFPKTSLTIFGVIANIGLICFMFLVGLELDLAMLRQHARSALIISFSSMLVPFICGVLVATGLFYTIMDESVPMFTFLFFIGVAMSITAVHLSYISRI